MNRYEQHILTNKPKPNIPKHGIPQLARLLTSGINYGLDHVVETRYPYTTNHVYSWRPLGSRSEEYWFDAEFRHVNGLPVSLEFIYE